jgi:hypothetical protein
MICNIIVHSFHHERVLSTSSLKNSHHGNVAMLAPNPDANGRNKRVISPNDISKLFNSNNRIKPTNNRGDDEDDEDYDLEVEDEDDDEADEVELPRAAGNQNNYKNYDINSESTSESSAILKMKELERLAFTGQTSAVIDTTESDYVSPSSSTARPSASSDTDESDEYDDNFADLTRSLDNVRVRVTSLVMLVLLYISSIVT